MGNIGQILLCKGRESDESFHIKILIKTLRRLNQIHHVGLTLNTWYETSNGDAAACVWVIETFTFRWVDALCTATALVVPIWNGEHRCGDALGAHVSLDLSVSGGWLGA